MYAKFSGQKQSLKAHHHIRLDGEFKNDCKTWLSFLDQGKGETNIYRPMVDFSSDRATEILDFFSDASGSKKKGGFGCYYKREWCWGKWNNEFMVDCNPSIEYLELVALVMGVFIWSSKLSNRRVVIFCDNEAVVNMTNNNSSSCKNCMVLLRKLVLRSLSFNFRIFVKHVTTQNNGIADAISRQNWNRFKRLTMDRKMKELPEDLPSELWPIENLWVK